MTTCLIFLIELFLYKISVLVFPAQAGIHLPNEDGCLPSQA